MVRRSWSEAASDCASRRSRSSWLLWSRLRQAPVEQRLDGAEQQEATEHDRGERAQDPLCRRVDPRGRLVGLEQQPCSFGILDRDVHLEQLIEVGLVGVLILGQVGELGMGLAGGEHLLLVLAQGELRSDAFEVIGVQDGSVVAPDLRGDDLVAQD